MPATPERPSDPAVTRPPEGTLHAGDGAVAGRLGTYCWVGHCVDGPPGADKAALPLARTDGGKLAFRLADSSLFGEWVASYADEPGGELTEIARGGEFDPDVSGATPSVGEATFPAPPAGDWVVHVQIFAPRGDAAYWWHVVTE